MHRRGASAEYGLTLDEAAALKKRIEFCEQVPPQRWVMAGRVDLETVNVKSGGAAGE
jgi:hypothetical protein